MHWKFNYWSCIEKQYIYIMENFLDTMILAISIMDMLEELCLAKPYCWWQRERHRLLTIQASGLIINRILMIREIKLLFDLGTICGMQEVYHEKIHCFDKLF